MNALEQTELNRKVFSSGISMSFVGFVSYDFIDSVIALISNRLEQVEANLNTRKKLYGVLIECLQNLCKHVDDDTPAAPHGEYDKLNTIFSFETDEAGYHIIVANFVANDKAEGLGQMLEQINSLDKPQLKELYTQVLRNNKFSEKGGAGLGLIDIARKVEQKLDYDLSTVDEVNSFFTLRITINK
jgi:hypothetical protein